MFETIASKARDFLTTRINIVAAQCGYPIGNRAIEIIFHDKVDTFGISNTNGHLILVANTRLMEKKFARKLPTEDRPSTLEGQLAQSREQLYENFSDDMIDGSIAHELGHLVEPPNQISPQMTNLINRITLLAILTIGIIGSLKLCLAGIILFSFYLIYKETDHIKHIQKSEFLADQFSAQIPRYRQGLIQVFTKFQTHFNLLKQAEAHHLRLEKKEINELQAHAYRNILHTTKRAFLKLFNVNFEEEENLIDHPTYAERIYNL